MGVYRYLRNKLSLRPRPRQLVSVLVFAVIGFLLVNHVAYYDKPTRGRGRGPIDYIPKEHVIWTDRELKGKEDPPVDRKMQLQKIGLVDNPPDNVIRHDRAAPNQGEWEGRGGDDGQGVENAPDAGGGDFPRVVDNRNEDQVLGGDEGEGKKPLQEAVEHVVGVANSDLHGGDEQKVGVGRRDEGQGGIAARPREGREGSENEVDPDLQKPESRVGAEDGAPQRLDELPKRKTPVQDGEGAAAPAAGGRSAAEKERKERLRKYREEKRRRATERRRKAIADHASHVSKCADGDKKCRARKLAEAAARMIRNTTTTTTTTTTTSTTTTQTTTVDRDDPNIAVEFPIYRAAAPTKGYPWPYPASFLSNDSAVFKLHPIEFSLKSVFHTCDILDSAIGRYKRSVQILMKQSANWTRGEEQRSDPVNNTIDSLEIKIKSPCNDAMPSLEMKEWYALMVTSRVAVLYADEVWGALRGLETFRQLLYPEDGEVRVNFTMIEDSPRFKHRGVHMDTARHYLSLNTIKENLEAMAQNKFNVLHWHLTDDQSFPLYSPSFPNLSKKGAYHPSMVYHPHHVAEIIEFARLRGIRVMPEIDTPGHTRSWGHAYPDLLSDCQHNSMKGPLDPIRNETYRFLHSLFGDVVSIFKDDFLHLGGDETSFVCWQRNKEIVKFLQSVGRPDDYHYLEKYYFDRLLVLLRTLKRKTSPIVWQEVFDNGILLTNDTVIAVWKGNEYSTIGAITAAGYRVISTSCWYLNYIKYSTSWHRYYLCDPQDFNYNSYPEGEKLKERVIGGEACMWGEFVDDANLMTTLWPRAIAVAERLWSPQEMRDPRGAEGRFEEHNCRMRSRGLKTSAENGPSSCLHSQYYNNIWIRSFIPDHPEWDMQ